MFTRMGGWAAMLSIVCMALPASAEKLGVGDPAPALTIGKWIKGEPVDLSKAKEGEIYVVEFWATWCPPCRTSIPHMSEMQAHFKDRKVTFVGISDEDEKTVKGFLEDGWDEKMRYTVALDKNDKTNETWMKAAGQEGIPCAFIVKDGKIAWIGHPMGGLDLKVAELCGDEAYAKKAKEIQELQEKIGKSFQEEKWKDGLAAADKLLTLKPGDGQWGFVKFMILATKTKDTQAATKWGHEFAKTCNDAEALNQFAWAILTEEDFADVKDVKLATIAAKKAMELTNEKDAAIVDTYARALFDAGKVDAAIEYQKKAIAVCKNERMKADLKKTLAQYEDEARVGEDDDDGGDD